MFDDDNVQPETKGNQKVLPVTVKFSVSCEVNPADPKKPICKLIYKKPPFLGLVETVEDEIDAEFSEETIEVEEDEASSDSIKESKPRSMKKMHPGKISEKSVGEAEDENASEMILHCVAKSVEDSA